MVVVVVVVVGVVVVDVGAADVDVTTTSPLSDSPPEALASAEAVASDHRPVRAVLRLAPGPAGR